MRAEWLNQASARIIKNCIERPRWLMIIFALHTLKTRWYIYTFLKRIKRFFLLRSKKKKGAVVQMCRKMDGKKFDKSAEREAFNWRNDNPVRARSLKVKKKKSKRMLERVLFCVYSQVTAPSDVISVQLSKSFFFFYIQQNNNDFILYATHSGGERKKNIGRERIIVHRNV